MGGREIMKKTTTHLRFLHCCLLLLGVLLLAVGPAQATHVKVGDILVVDVFGGPSAGGALFVVNPKTGQRAVLSDFGNPAQGPLGSFPISVALGVGRQIFVSDLGAGSGSEGALFELKSILTLAIVPCSATSARVIFMETSTTVWQWLTKAG
jgi:hypothetical protein